jgi:hypothetical protein
MKKRKTSDCGCMSGNPFALNATTKAMARATFYCQFEVINSGNVGKRAVFCDVAKWILIKQVINFKPYNLLCSTQ